MFVSICLEIVRTRIVCLWENALRPSVVTCRPSIMLFSQRLGAPLDHLPSVDCDVPLVIAAVPANCCRLGRHLYSLSFAFTTIKSRPILPAHRSYSGRLSTMPSWTLIDCC
ncbi:unnamed protein product [Ectocarpus fasciculatus]